MVVTEKFLIFFAENDLGIFSVIIFFHFFKKKVNTNAGRCPLHEPPFLDMSLISGRGLFKNI